MSKRQKIFALLLAAALLSGLGAACAQEWLPEEATARLSVTIATEGTPPETPEQYGIRLTAWDSASPLPEGGAGGVWESDKVTTAGTIPFEIRYTNVGIHHYTVEQVIPDAADRGPGMTYATAKYELRVTIHRENGLLEVTARFYDDQKAKSDTVTYTNVRETSTLTVKKQVKVPSDKFVFAGKSFAFTVALSQPATVPAGYRWPDGVTTEDNQHFTFRLEDQQSKTLPELPIGVGYSVVEEEESGYTADQTGDTGSISADGSSALFVNSYAVEPFQVTLSAFKKLTGRAWLEGETYSFTLTGDHAPMPEQASGAHVTVDQDAAVIFDEISFTEPGTYRYTIREDLPEGVSEATGYTRAGVVYDHHALGVTVTVTDNQDGTLSTEVEYDGGKVFTNAYHAQAELEIPVVKKLTGRDFQPGDSWAFELSGNDTKAPMPQTAEIEIHPEEGSEYRFAFGPIRYDETHAGQTFEYIIREDEAKTVAGVTNAVNAAVKVLVTDNSDGTLTLTPEYINKDGGTGSASLTNQYRSGGGLAISAQKTLTGRALEDGQFTFELTDAAGNVLQTRANAADGTIVFDEITYKQTDVDPTTHTGTRTYFVREVIPEDAESSPYTYDEEPLEILVVLTDDTLGNITAEQETVGEKTALENHYSAAGAVQLSATKSLEGAELAAGQYTFELRDSTGRRLQRVTNNRDGGVVFDTIHYTQDDVPLSPITYRITEVNTEEPNVTYDTHTLTVNVTLTDNGDGTITATPAYVGERTFLNTYTAPRYTVTVIYRYLRTGRTAAPTVTEEHAEGEPYDIPSPSIRGYRVTRVRVSGKQPGRNITEYVYYIPDEEIIDDYDPALGLGQVIINVGDCLE